MSKDKIKYLGEFFAENIVDSYKSLSNINKHLSQIQTSEIKELKKLVTNIKKLLKHDNSYKKELEALRKIYNKEYKEHLQKINKIFKDK